MIGPVDDRDRAPSQRRDPAGPRRAGADFGVYVHVPFCIRRCDYCDFATWTDRHHLVDDYVAACVADLRHHARADRPGDEPGPLPAATSVFFGGGTPSLLRPDQLAAVLDEIDRAPGAEVTVECNPDTVDAERLAGYRAAGVTRISLGVQSFVPHVLAALGRTHLPANVEVAVAAVRSAGIPTFNLDLIYGAAGESPADWARTLDEALGLDPPHVSAYALTVEPGTPLARRVAAGADAPDDDDQADKYVVADERLQAAGLEAYEISNWARPGHECRHNLLYWRQGEYLGIGCAAHGHTGGRRWWTVRTPERYIDLVTSGRRPEAGGEALDAQGRAEEALTLALRTRAGASVDAGSPRAAAVLDDLAAAGLVERSDGAVRLTRPGRLVANDITARLLAAGAGGARPGRAGGGRYPRGQPAAGPTLALPTGGGGARHRDPGGPRHDE
jgi:oxygen-independent coproporphyrinogen-3 oxidase